MRFKIIYIALFISVIAKAQHFPIYSQYLLNGLVINPAYAGSRDVLSASAMFRNQWVGFDGAPITGTLSAHLPLRNKSVAVGLLFVNEKMGFENNLSFYGNYAYRFQVDRGFLSFGLKGGFDMLKADNAKVTTQATDDNIALVDNKSHLMLNAGFGVYYYNSDYFLGLSVPRLISYKKTTEDLDYVPYNNVSNYNYLISGGALLDFMPEFKLKPSVLFRYQANTALQYDLNCNVILLKDALWLGASYRASDAIVGIIEYQINTQMRIGYSYDYSTGALSNYNSGTHEIMLRYEFRYKVSAVNPKYF